METIRGDNRERKRDVGNRGARRVLPLLGGIGVLGLLLLAAPPEAAAGDDFERGFKRELGAIAAHEAVGIGRHILGGVIAGGYGHSGYYGRYHRRSYYDRPFRRGYRSYHSYYGYRPYGRPYRPYRRPHVVHEHHHYYGDDCY